jgi:hypothetical protein
MPHHIGQFIAGLQQGGLNRFAHCQRDGFEPGLKTEDLSRIRHQNTHAR